MGYVQSTTADLVIAHGTAGAADGTSASMTATEVVDRVDVAPGINPVLGAFVSFESGGARHLVYVDQELPDQRLTKWLRRPTGDFGYDAGGGDDGASPEPWQISLLAPELVPIAVSAQPGGAVILGMEIAGDPAAAAALLHAALPVEGQKGAAPRRDVFSSSARLGVPRQGAPPDWRPLIHAVSCGDGVTTSFLVAQPDGGWAHVPVVGGTALSDTQLAHSDLAALPTDGEAEWPMDVVCLSAGLVTLLARPDHRLRGTDAWELVFSSGGGEQAITLAREVTEVALVAPGPPAAAGAAPAREQTGPRQLLEQLRILFSERALDATTPPRFQLVMIEPRRDTDAVAFGRRVLWSGLDRIIDFAAVAAGPQLIVAFRTTSTAAPVAGDSAGAAGQTGAPARMPLRLLSAPLTIQSAR